MELFRQLDRAAETAGAYCERRKVLLLYGFSILYLFSTCLLAARKPLWNDELFTFYIASLPSVSDIWSALLTGGEQIPPFFHLITRMSLFLFGANGLATRLPEVLGFLVMSLCLFRFVAKRFSALSGFAAMLFPLVTSAYYYAYEGRPYGIVLGFAGVSLACWQSAAEGCHRKLSLIGLAVSFAAAVSSHYYAVLLLVPLAVGEAIRSCSLRRLDFAIWIALGFGMVPLILFMPLIRGARTYSAHFGAPLQWSQISDFYTWLLTPALLPFMVMLLLQAFYPLRFVSAPDQAPRLKALSHEIGAALAFIAIPIIAVTLAKLVTGAFVVRYVLPSVLGFSILLAVAAYRLSDGRAIMSALFVLSLSMTFIALQVRDFRYVSHARERQAKTQEFLRLNSQDNLPIVVSDLHTFMELAYHAPRDLASRVFYLADPQASLRYLGHTSVDQGILDLQPWFHVNIERYKPYVASHQRFLVYVSGRYLNNATSNIHWLLSELATTNRPIRLRSRYEDGLLFLITSEGA
jgi:dolichyl-phosphate-mannose-protein mannosyltransferase